MEDVGLVKSFEALDNLDEDSPNFLFLQICLFLLVTSYLLEEIALVTVLHNDATNV